MTTADTHDKGSGIRQLPALLKPTLHAEFGWSDTEPAFQSAAAIAVAGSLSGMVRVHVLLHIRVHAA